MTAIARITNEPEIETYGSTGLEAWARNAQLATQVARQLALTPFTPQSLLVHNIDERGRPTGINFEATVGNVLGALLVGDELGLRPMAALRSIDVIRGVPALRAIALRAIVQSAGHDLVVVEANTTRAIVRGRRRYPDHWGDWQESRWDADRARKLGLLGKENYAKQPAAMYVARATAECARLIAADALLGIPYSAEELDDDLVGLETAAQNEAPAPPKRTARRRTASKPEAVERPADPAADAADIGPEPDLEPPAGPAAEPDLASKPQLTKLHVTLGENELAQREAGLAYISQFVGRQITSSKDLTKDEATRLIDHLERRAAERRAASNEPDLAADEPPLEEPPPPDEEPA